MKTILLSFGAMALFACNNPQVTQDQNMDNATQPSNQPAEEAPTTSTYVYVVMETSMGTVTLELDSTRAPQTVTNFLSYVDEGHFNGTIFHRIIDNFMVQGGGFLPDGTQKPVKDPIFLESQNGLTNEVGTIAMARTNAPHSATAQFFINVKENDFLNYAPGNPGYAVFGKVAAGMEVINEMRKVETGVFQQYRDWPVNPVVITSMRRE